MLRGLFLSVSLLLVGAPSGQALGPHELVLIVNGNSADSVSIAGFYARTRGIPKQNIIQLDLPDSFSNETKLISPQDFTTHIWEPANKQAKPTNCSFIF